MNARWLALSVLLAVIVPSNADAHAFAPALFELRQLEAAVPDAGPAETVDAVRYAVRFKQPAARAAGSRLQPILPDDCRATDASAEREGTGIVALWTATCAEPLVGREIGVAGIAGSQADVLLRLELLDEDANRRSIREVLTADRSAITVPERENALDVAAAYAELGVEHILAGTDHLLFVLALLLLVGGGRGLLVTVTAFTLGHSITLALATFGLVHLPQAPVEVAIAFSIYVMAIELSRHRGAFDGARRGDAGSTGAWSTAKGPWTAAGFGLLHGLGFAGALSEAGLPDGEVPAALFSFNLGIEAGQLLFVVGVLVVGWLGREATRRLPISRPAWLARVPAYAIGSTAIFWVIERAIGLL